MQLDLLAVNHAVFPIESKDGLNLGELYDALEDRINKLTMAHHDPIMLRACTRTYDQILEITRRRTPFPLSWLPTARRVRLETPIGTIYVVCEERRPSRS